MYCLIGAILRINPDRSEDRVFVWQLVIGLFAMAVYNFG
jgi:hypothetical protein